MKTNFRSATTLAWGVSIKFPNANSVSRNFFYLFYIIYIFLFIYLSKRERKWRKYDFNRTKQYPRTSLSIWRAVCQTVNAIRCKRVSVSSRSGVSSLRLLFTVSWRVSPQRQQFARSQARDSELLFEFVMVLRIKDP